MRRVWGMNNREAPLRVCTDAHGEPNNMEYKALDATANPYLALAVLIIAGLEACLFRGDMHVPDLTCICKRPPLDVTLQRSVPCASTRALAQRSRSVHHCTAGRSAVHAACSCIGRGPGRHLMAGLSAGHQPAPAAARANLSGPRYPGGG